MKKQALGIIAALFAFMAMLPVGAYAADNAYAILYEDGTLVFQKSDATEGGRAVKQTYEVDLNAVYTNKSPTPWYDERESIRVVSFADKFSPTSTGRWFMNCVNLERVENIQNLDTSKATGMFLMFRGCSILKVLDVSHFDTANVTEMSHMFQVCSGLAALDVSHFDTVKATLMHVMLSHCEGLSAPRKSISRNYLYEAIRV